MTNGAGLKGRGGATSLAGNQRGTGLVAFQPQANFMPFVSPVLPVHDHFLDDFLAIERHLPRFGRREDIKRSRSPDARNARTQRIESAHFRSS
jgi:hypothetical protein